MTSQCVASFCGEAIVVMYSVSFSLLSSFNLLLLLQRQPIVRRISVICNWSDEATDLMCVANRDSGQHM